jgi:DNA polymerase-1
MASATSLKIPRAEAQQMIDRYFEAIPAFAPTSTSPSPLRTRARLSPSPCMAASGTSREYQQSSNFQLVALWRAHGHEPPHAGHRGRHHQDCHGSRAEKRLAEEGLKSKLVLQIHDELDFEVPLTRLRRISQLVKETMEGVAQLKVPLIAEVSSGATGRRRSREWQRDDLKDNACA